MPNRCSEHNLVRWTIRTPSADVRACEKSAGQLRHSAAYRSSLGIMRKVAVVTGHLDARFKVRTGCVGLRIRRERRWERMSASHGIFADGSCIVTWAVI